MSSVLVPVNADAIIPEVRMPVRLFVQGTSDTAPSLMASPGSAISVRTRKKLVDAGLKVLVRSADREQLIDFLYDELVSRIDNENECSTTRLALLLVVLRDKLRRAFLSKQTESIVTTIRYWAKILATHLPVINPGKKELYRILEDDSEHATHSTKVGVFACLLASKLRFQFEELEELLVGAMVSDIGKLEIPHHLLAKPKRLSPQEYRHMQSHVVRGFTLLSDIAGVTRNQLLMTYQHHEQIDGTGYPVGIPDELIHDWSKLLSVVDVFAALTSRRPFRPAMQPQKALSLMRPMAGTAFDVELFKCWDMMNQDKAAPKATLTI